MIVRQGRASGPFNISLRPMTLTDPPLLVSLPFLLADTLVKHQRHIRHKMKKDQFGAFCALLWPSLSRLGMSNNVVAAQVRGTDRS